MTDPNAKHKIQSDLQVLARMAARHFLSSTGQPIPPGTRLLVDYSAKTFERDADLSGCLILLPEGVSAGVSRHLRLPREVDRTEGTFVDVVERLADRMVPFFRKPGEKAGSIGSVCHFAVDLSNGKLQEYTSEEVFPVDIKTDRDVSLVNDPVQVEGPVPTA